jgi:hypothetical protein
MMLRCALILLAASTWAPDLRGQEKRNYHPLGLRAGDTVLVRFKGAGGVLDKGQSVTIQGGAVVSDADLIGAKPFVLFINGRDAKVDVSACEAKVEEAYSFFVDTTGYDSVLTLSNGLSVWFRSNTGYLNREQAERLLGEALEIKVKR